MRSEGSIQDYEVRRISDVIVDYWKKRGFDIDPYGKGLVNGLPSGFDRVTPRSGNVSLPRRIGLDQLSGLSKKDLRKVRAKVRRRAEDFADRVTREVTESYIAEIEKDLAEILDTARIEFERSQIATFRKATTLVDNMARMYGYERDDVLGKSRPSGLIRARFHIYTVLRDELKMSYSQIGRVMKRDHSTVMHGIERYRNDFSVVK